MASRRFTGYDPYDYYYTSPYHYAYPDFSRHHHPAPARSFTSFFPAAGGADQYYRYQDEPATVRGASGFFPSTWDVDPYYQPAPARHAARNVEPAAARDVVSPKAGAPRSSVPIPVRFDSSDPEPKIAVTPAKRAPSAEAAAARIQAAARGFMARRAVRALRAVEREAEEVAEKLAREAEALRGDARARVGVGEALMRLLLRLDAVRGAREYRKRVAKRVLALQDAVDALEQRPVVEDALVEVVPEITETKAGETVPEEENAVATEMPGAVEEESGVTEAAVVEMEVDGNRAAPEETKPAVVDGEILGADEPVGEAVGGEWEMVAEGPAAAVPAASDAPQAQDPAEVTRRTPAEADGGSADTKKLMEMVAALCEQSAQQCAVIGALAERVDALERAVRRVEDAERRRRRAKKLRKAGKGSNHVKCYSSD